MLLCFDPGETTGFALFTHHMLTHVGTTTKRADIVNLLYALPPHATVVCEDFRAVRLSKGAHNTLMLIGVIDYVTECTTGRPPHYQRPQERRSFLPLAKALLGLRTPEGKAWRRHHQDAVAHGLWYLHQQEPSIASEDITLSPSLHVGSTFLRVQEPPPEERYLVAEGARERLCTKDQQNAT